MANDQNDPLSAARALFLSLMQLRADAIKRGMIELAVVYGWSATRVGFEILKAAQQKRLPNADA